MKKNSLIIFKWPNYLNKYLISKFSNFYNVESLYLTDYKKENFSEIIDHINQTIISKNINVVFFDVDFMKFINFFFIQKIEKNVKKILVTYDDYALHEMNAITANACDVVLSQCPLSVLKYKEKGYEAYFMPPENDGTMFKNYNLEKKIDVLFFGQVRADRRDFIDFLTKNGISVKTVGDGSGWVDDNELFKLISKSKIVLNFSKSLGSTVASYMSEDVYKFHYHLKGRIIQSGLCGTLCVSEYSPGQEVIFNENDLPTFQSKEECLDILKRFLDDEELLKKSTINFCSKVSNLYEEKKNFEPIYKAIDKKHNKKVELANIPYWYLRIVAKQIIIRNIKLSNIVTNIFQFKEIFQIIKNSNFKSKLLILLESLINIIWYSIYSSIKNRKKNT